MATLRTPLGQWAEQSAKMNGLRLLSYTEYDPGDISTDYRLYRDSYRVEDVPDLSVDYQAASRYIRGTALGENDVVVRVRLTPDDTTQRVVMSAFQRFPQLSGYATASLTVNGVAEEGVLVVFDKTQPVTTVAVQAGVLNEDGTADFQVSTTVRAVWSESRQEPLLTLDDNAPADWQFLSMQATGNAGEFTTLLTGAFPSAAYIDSVTSDKNSIVDTGKDVATLTALVLDGQGNVMEGVAVSWSTTLGTLTSLSSVTNASGQASTQLTADQEGTATVTAQLDNGSRATLTITVEDKSVNYVVHSLTSDKDSIVNDGTDAATLTAIVYDDGGSIVTGATVYWSTTLGSVTPATSVTGADGKATSTLTDSGDTGTTQVTASLDNGSTKTIGITVEDRSVGYIIQSLTSDKDNIVNDGTDAATLTAIVYDDGGSIVTGATVYWSTTLGSVTPATSVTGADGKATSILTDSGDTGTTQVTASLDNGSTKTIGITVEDRSVSYIIQSLTSDKDSIFNDGTDAAALTATVHDGSGNMVAGATVYWSTTLGSVTPATSVTGADGKATSTLTDSGDTGTTQVTASLDNGSTKTIGIIVEDRSVSYIIQSLTSDKDSIVNDGTDAATLTATVVDANGVVVEGVIVSWSTSVGTLSESESVTNTAGQATTQLTSTDDGTALVVAVLDNGNTADTSVVVSAIDINSLVSDKDSISDSGDDVATLTATVTNEQGAPVTEVMVNWSTTVGVLSVSSSVTNAEGKAVVQLTSTDVGTALISARLNNGAEATASVSIYSPVFIETLVSDKTQVLVDGKDNATITATVTDDKGQPASNVVVHWSSTGGTLSSESVSTGSNGEAKTSFSSNIEGDFIVTAMLDNGDNKNIDIAGIVQATSFPAFSASNVRVGNSTGTIAFDLATHDYPGGINFVFKFYTTPVSGNNPGSPVTTVYLTDTTNVVLYDSKYSVASEYIMQDAFTELNGSSSDTTATLNIIVENLYLDGGSWQGGYITCEYQPNAGLGPWTACPDIFIPALG
ncbi:MULTISPECIES: beta strand repeat-containing protein [Enterobacterales]|uniref:beta strand repeat-containing protein n=1 Tax=Enterobacterales TaxID=91347 RepID=UPI002ED8CD65